MNDETNPVSNFLTELKDNDIEKYELLSRLRAMVFDLYPNVNETFKYGGILFSLNDDFGGLFVYKNHISFEFSYGYKLASKLKLEGNGKYRRHLKFKTINDIHEEPLKDLLRQIKSIDNL